MRKEYDPCIGCRVNKELMIKIKSSGLSNSELIRKAIVHYLSFVVNKNKDVVNKPLYADKYAEVIKEIDETLGV